MRQALYTYDDRRACFASALKRALCTVATLAVVAMLPGQHAGATIGADQHDSFMGHAPMSEAELAGYRGGMKVNGMSFDFAVEVKFNSEVFENGKSVGNMQSVMKLSKVGKSVSKSVTGNVNNSASKNASKSANDGVSRSSGGGASNPTSSTSSNGDGPKSSGGGGNNGFMMTSGNGQTSFTFNDGKTSIAHNVAKNHLSTVVQNTGNERTVNTSVETNVTMTNFMDKLGEFKASRLSAKLGRRIQGLR